MLKGKEHEQIRVTIKHDSINSDRQYEALSYVWGDHSKNKKPIYVDDKSVLWATENLWTALKHVRRSTEHVVLWVDAISIDQSDNADKRKQLPHMCWIYPQAKRVLCWLGKDDDGTFIEAFNILESWAKAFTSRDLLLQLVAEARENLATGRTGQFEALAALFDRPYWRRAWCLQEVCVDQTKPPRLLCGKQELCWKMLYMGFISLAGTLETYESLHLMGENVGYVLPMLMTCWSPSNKLLMTNLMTQAARREASIAHDMIFSLLGLAERRGVKYPDPDYERTIEETCITYTRAIIAIDQQLDVLGAVAPFREGDTVPSWCIKPGRWAITVANDMQPLARRRRGEHCYVATKDMKPWVQESERSTDPVLKLVGVRLDKITQIFNPRASSLETFDKANTWADVMQLCSEFCSQYFLSDMYRDSDEKIITAFLRTLTCDAFWISAVKESDETSLNRFYIACEARFDKIDDLLRRVKKEQLERYLRMNFSFHVGSREDEIDDAPMANEIRASALGEFVDRRACSELKSTIDSKVRERRFFVTEQGYIGIGPPECAIGDTLCLFPGSTVPFVLRRKRHEEDSKYLFVGDAYVHGVMYGEALKGKLKGNESPKLDESNIWNVFSII